MELLRIENLCKIYGSGKTRLPPWTMSHSPSKRGNLLQLSELPDPANPRCSTSSAA